MFRVKCNAAIAFGCIKWLATFFINYRRDDSSGVAGRLHDLLSQTFGSNKLFMDVNNIPVRSDFVDHLKGQVGACDAMLDHKRTFAQQKAVSALTPKADICIAKTNVR